MSIMPIVMTKLWSWKLSWKRSWILREFLTGVFMHRHMHFRGKQIHAKFTTKFTTVFTTVFTTKFTTVFTTVVTTKFPLTAISSPLLRFHSLSRHPLFDWCSLLNMDYNLQDSRPWLQNSQARGYNDQFLISMTIMYLRFKPDMDGSTVSWGIADGPQEEGQQATVHRQNGGNTRGIVTNMKNNATGS